MDYPLKTLPQPTELPLTQFVQLYDLTSEKGKLLNGRTGLVAKTASLAPSADRISVILFPLPGEPTLPQGRTYSFRRENLLLIEEKPRDERNFTVAHFEQLKTRMLGDAPLLHKHPAVLPKNAVELDEVNLSKDDLHACQLHFRFSETGYANGKWVKEIPLLGKVSYKSPSLCGMKLHEHTKSLGANCHEQWRDITTKLRTLFTPEELHELMHPYYREKGGAVDPTNREYQIGNIMEPTYFMHIYGTSCEALMHSSGTEGFGYERLAGVTEDDYLHWRGHNYKLELRVPKIRNVLHVSSSSLTTKDFLGGCCHSASETLFLRGATQLNVTALCSGFVLSAGGAWYHHSWLLDDQNRIIETRTDKDSESPSNFSIASGLIAYACVAECRSREDLFKWRLQEFNSSQFKMASTLLPSMATQIGINFIFPNMVACEEIETTFRHPEEWHKIFARGGGRSYHSKQQVFSATGGTNKRIGTTFADWKDTICMITRGRKLPETNPHHIGHVMPSNYFVNAREMNLRMGDDVHPVPSQFEIDNIRPFDSVKVNIQPGLRFWCVVLQVGTNGFRGVASFSGPVEHQHIHGIRHGSVLEFCHEHVMDIMFGHHTPSDVFVGCMKRYVKDIGTTFCVDDLDAFHQKYVVNVNDGRFQTWGMRKHSVPQFVHQLLPPPPPTDPTAAWQSPLQEELVDGVVSLLCFWNQAFDDAGGSTHAQSPPSVSSSSSSSSSPPPRVRVRLVDLTNSTELNGQLGTRTEWSEQKGRFKVVLDNKTIKKRGYVMVRPKNIQIVSASDKEQQHEDEKEKFKRQFQVKAGKLQDGKLQDVAVASKRREEAVQYAIEANEAAEQRHDVQEMSRLAQKAIDADPSYFAGYVLRARVKCFQGMEHEGMRDFDTAYANAKRDNMLEEADNPFWNLGKWRMQCRRTVRLKDQGMHLSATCPGGCSSTCCSNKP
jgi:hypothetical protein